MKKRVCCLLMVGILIIFPFTTTASATGVGDVILEYILQYVACTANDVLGGEMSTEEIVEWASTAEGLAYIAACAATKINTVSGQYGGVELFSDAVGEVGTAQAGQYKVAKVTQDFVDKANSALNGYYNSGSAEIRNLSLEELGLTHYTKIVGSCGSYVCLGGGNGYGNYPFIQYSGSDYLSFTPGPIENTSYIYVFVGDGNYPPVITVPSGNLLYQNGVALPTGSYIVLNGTELYRIEYTNVDWGMRYTTGDTVDDIKVLYWHGYWGDKVGQIYSNGVAYSTNSTDGTGVSGYDLLDKLVKSVGIVLDIGDSTPTVEPFTSPDITPYADDDGYVYCLCRCDEPSAPVFMSADTYNNYVNNGTIVDDDSVTNNIFTDEQLSNYYDCYNTYITNNYYEGSSYDDTNLLNKLEGWFSDISSKLDDIYTKMATQVSAGNVQDILGDLLGFDDFDSEQFQLDWKTLVQMKLPILFEVEDLINELANTSSPLVLETENPMNWLLGAVPEEERHENFVVDVAWFSDIEYKGLPGRSYIRKGLSIVVYVAFFVALYKRTESIFRDL